MRVKQNVGCIHEWIWFGLVKWNWETLRSNHFTLINSFFCPLIFTALSLKAGKENITSAAPRLFACRKITFPTPFYGGQQVKVFASVGHTVKSAILRNGAAIWVEDVSVNGFTACLVEYAQGSNGTTEVNWMALQSAPPGSQMDTTFLEPWTSGTTCKKIAFKQVS